MAISPKEIHGNWDKGYALDVHTLSSEYIGDYPNGFPKYRTVRTELGELLYELKYNQDFSKIQKIMCLIEDFVIDNFKGKVNYVLPVPPTKKRRVQHMYEIASEIAYLLNCGYSNCVLKNVSVGEAKNDNTQRKIVQTRNASSKRNILLVDDITNTGNTAEACVDVLKSDSNINKVYFLTLTVRRTAYRR